MAHNANPFTANDNVDALELPSGDLIFFDLDDGLVYGDAELPAGIKADDLFLNRYGRERPDGYKDHLARVAEADPDAKVPDLHSGSAQDVLAGKSQVFVTTAKIRDLRKEIGLHPSTQSVGAVKLHPDRINVTDLSSGPTHNKDLQQSLSAATQARAEADAQSVKARQRSTRRAQPAEPGGQKADATGTAATPTTEDDGDAGPKTPTDQQADDGSKSVRELLSEQTDDELRATAAEPQYLVENADTLSREDLITAILVRAGYSGDNLTPPES